MYRVKWVVMGGWDIEIFERNIDNVFLIWKVLEGSNDYDFIENVYVMFEIVNL